MVLSETGANPRRIYFWNSMGGLCNALLSIFVIMAINRIVGTYEAGIFTLAYANGMLLQHIGSFDSRSNQCADASNRFDFSDYFTFRLCTCGLMAIATAVFIYFSHYTAEKAAVTGILSLFFIFGNISDIFQGLAQLNERLDISGQSLSFRIVINLAAFITVLFFSKNLYAAAACMTLTSFC